MNCFFEGKNILFIIYNYNLFTKNIDKRKFNFFCIFITHNREYLLFLGIYVKKESIINEIMFFFVWNDVYLKYKCRQATLYFIK